MRLALLISLAFASFSGTAVADSERWILYGSPYEPGSARYRRVIWDNMAMVVIDRAEERGGIQLWALSTGTVSHLGNTPIDSQSSRDIERLVRSEPKRWIKGFVLGAPGQPGAPMRIEAYGDITKVKAIWRGSLIDTGGTDSFCCSFSDKGDPPLFAVVDSEASWDIQDMIRVSMEPSRQTAIARKPAPVKAAPLKVAPAQKVAQRTSQAKPKPARTARRSWRSRKYRFARRPAVKAPPKTVKAPLPAKAPYGFARTPAPAAAGPVAAPAKPKPAARSVRRFHRRPAVAPPVRRKTLPNPPAKAAAPRYRSSMFRR